jgi:hypothetical protein
MWFDANAVLSALGAERENSARPPATPATSATKAPRVAIVASVATPPAQKPKHEAPKQGKAQPLETFPHGLTCAGHPLTWTGRVVSLDEWRHLTEWERHGPRRRQWNGIKKQWETPERDRQ